MKIINQLDNQALLDLDDLCQNCQQHDGSLIPIYKTILSEKRTMNCNTLLYEQEHLIGFLSPFFFYDDACEIALMVAPSHRKKGLASHLLKTILPLLHNKHMKHLIFSTSHNPHDAWLKNLGFNYKSSEYEMQRTLTFVHEINRTYPPTLTIRPATIEDIPDLSTIDQACFQSQRPDMHTRFENLLHRPNYQLFIIQLDGVTIGKAHLRLSTNQSHITDVAILPTYQGKGYGSALLHYCINYSLQNSINNIYLEVETSNSHALNLYKRLGFTITNAYNFWSTPISNPWLSKIAQY